MSKKSPLVALLMFAGGIAVATTGCRDPSYELPAAWQSVSVKMTVEEIYSVMGPPDEKNADPISNTTAVLWRHRSASGTHQLELKLNAKGELYSISKTSVAWPFASLLLKPAKPNRTAEPIPPSRAGSP